MKLPISPKLIEGVPPAEAAGAAPSDKLLTSALAPCRWMVRRTARRFPFFRKGVSPP
jgi:hypothetical protein